MIIFDIKALLTKSGEDVLISGRLQFKENYRSQRKTLNNCKIINPPERHDYPKCVHKAIEPQDAGTKIRLRLREK